MKLFAKKARLGLGITALCVAGLFVSCMTTSISKVDTIEEMSIAILETGEMKEAHYSPAEISEWKVLVIDTGNSKRTFEMLEKLSSDMTKYKNPGAAQDADASQLKMYQDVRLKKAFKDVTYANSVNGDYDLIILRDVILHIGQKSNQTTKTELSYWFVYKAPAENGAGQGKNYIYRGKYSASGSSIVPYPATSFGLQDANRSAVENMNILLEGGLDVYAFAD